MVTKRVVRQREIDLDMDLDTDSDPDIDPVKLGRIAGDGERALALLNRASRERRRRMQKRDERINQALMFTQDARMRRQVGTDQGTYRGYVFEQPGNKMQRACSHRHRTHAAALYCATRMTAEIRAERGITARRMRIENVTPAQLRTRLAYRMGLAGSTAIRKMVNQTLREHEGHDFKPLTYDENEIIGRVSPSIGFVCEYCDRVYVLTLGIEEG